MQPHPCCCELPLQCAWHCWQQLHVQLHPSGACQEGRPLLLCSLPWWWEWCCWVWRLLLLLPLLRVLPGLLLLLGLRILLLLLLRLGLGLLLLQ